MSENLELEKQLKLVKKTGSFVVGRREVSSSLKGAKLLVWSASANVPQVMLDECRILSVPAIKFAGNPVELGRACGIPFRVSVIAVKSPGDADLSGFAKSADYQAVFSGARSLAVEPKAKERPLEIGKAKESGKAKPKKLTKEKTEPDEKAPSAKKLKKSEEKPEEKERDRPKDKSAKTPKKSADSTKKTKKKKSDDDKE